MNNNDANNPWAGTPILNRINNPDGSIIFTLNSDKVGRQAPSNYTDRFVNTNKYKSEKKWYWYDGMGYYMVKYIPITE